MQFEIQEKENLTELTLSGDLVIMHAENLRDILTENLDLAPEMTITLKDVSSIDICGIQLLLSTQKSAINLEKKLKINIENSEIVQEIVESNGFSLESLLTQKQDDSDE